MTDMATASIVDNPEPATSAAPRPRWHWAVALALLAIFATVLLARGPLSATQDLNDFANFYAAARAWLAGANPYDLAALQHAWDHAPQTPDRQWSARTMVALYPPATFTLMAPIALLPFRAAVLAWTAINTIAVVALIAGVARLADVKLWSWHGLILAIAICALGPIQTGFRVGQMALVTTTLIIWGLAASHRHHAAILSGVLLGLAAGLKPQMGLVFVAYLVVRLRFQPAIVSICIFAAATAVAIGVMSAHGHDWWAGLSTNLITFTHHGAGDPTSSNPVAWQLLNLHYPLHLLIDSRSAVSAIVWTVVISLGLVSLALATPIHGARRTRHDLLFLSVIAVLSLLLVYHRFYDAVLLVLPIGWLVRTAAVDRWGVPHWLVAILLLPFAISGPAALHVAKNAELVPTWLHDSILWRGVLMPHQVLALVGLALALLYAQWSTRRTARY